MSMSPRSLLNIARLAVLYPLRIVKHVMLLPRTIALLQNSLSVDATTNAHKNSTVNNTIADNHDLDFFYRQFEDRFRGPEKDIEERLGAYTKLFRSLDSSLHEKKIVDIGCGRGEFLSFAHGLGLETIGVDMNTSMVERANSLGHVAVTSDALTYLSSQPTDALAAITGFHIVEHIPFESLLQIIKECFRTVAPGGFILFETPNPENLQVGATSFYMDPSHLHPLPSPLLAFAMEVMGFQVEIKYLHPYRTTLKHQDKEVEKLMQLAYGPRDYAVIGRKPAPKDD